MATVVPIRGTFTDVRSFIASVAEDADNIDAMLVVTKNKDGLLEYSHISMQRGDCALAALYIQDIARG